MEPTSQFDWLAFIAKWRIEIKFTSPQRWVTPGGEGYISNHYVDVGKTDTRFFGRASLEETMEAVRKHCGE